MKAQQNTLRRSASKQEFLLSTLRDHAKEPAIERVNEILSLLVAADAHLREQLRYLYHEPATGVPEFLDNHGRMRESERAYYQTLELLNIKLSRYRWEATLSGDINGFRSELIPAYPKDKWGYSGRGKNWDATELWKYSEYTEPFLAQRDELLAEIGVGELRPEDYKHSWDMTGAFMVGSLLEAVNKAEISRFRRCSECRQWFYAIRGYQHFCGEVCRRKHEAQSPAFKEKRARYMRETYRPREKREEAASKQQAGFSKTAKRRRGKL